MFVFSLKMISFQLFLKPRIDCTHATILTIKTMWKNHSLAALFTSEGESLNTKHSTVCVPFSK